MEPKDARICLALADEEMAVLAERDASRDGSVPHFKVTLVGEEGVGKSSIFRRIKDGLFVDDALSTLGLDQCETIREVPGSGATVRLHLWDTAGAERFRAMTKSYYRNTDAVVFVFSLDKSASLVSLKYWIDDVRALAPSTAQHFYVCNKIDLPDDDQVIYDNEIDSFFKSAEISQGRPFRTSAKENVGIKEAIDTVVKHLHTMSCQENDSTGDTIQVEGSNPLRPNMPAPEQSGCC